MKALEITLEFSRTLKYVASMLMKGYSLVRGRSLNSLTFSSSSLHASDTVDLEKLLPQRVSMTWDTFRVETPLTHI